MDDTVANGFLKIILLIGIWNLGFFSVLESYLFFLKPVAILLFRYLALEGDFYWRSLLSAHVATIWNFKRVNRTTSTTTTTNLNEFSYSINRDLLIYSNWLIGPDFLLGMGYLTLFREGQLASWAAPLGVALLSRSLEAEFFLISHGQTATVRFDEISVASLLLDQIGSWEFWGRMLHQKTQTSHHIVDFCYYVTIVSCHGNKHFNYHMKNLYSNENLNPSIPHLYNRKSPGEILWPHLW